MKKDILKAFYALGMWRIRNIFNPNLPPYYTAKDEEEMFNMLREKGYELFAANDKFYYFK